MLGIKLWKLSFTKMQSSGRMIIMMMVELVESRFTSSWTSLKELWYLPNYVEVVLKLGRELSVGNPSSWTNLKEVWYLPHYNEVAMKSGQ